MGHLCQKCILKSSSTCPTTLHYIFLPPVSCFQSYTNILFSFEYVIKIVCLLQTKYKLPSLINPLFKQNCNLYLCTAFNDKQHNNNRNSKIIYCRSYASASFKQPLPFENKSFSSLTSVRRKNYKNANGIGKYVSVLWR